MKSLQKSKTLFLGLAEARAGEHEYRGGYVSAEPLLNPVPTTSAASRNPRKTASSRERRAYQNVQQSPKHATGMDFENAGAVPEMTENRCPGVPAGAPWDRCPGGVPGCPCYRCPGSPRDVPGTPPGRGLGPGRP